MSGQGTDAGRAVRVGVAVPAAGVGVRMGGMRKAFLRLDGIAVLEHALRPFLADDRVVAVAVALAPDDAADPPAWIAGLDARIRVVAGGDTRTESVRRAIDALPEDVDVIAVHDAARPLVTGDVVARCIDAAAMGQGAVAGCPATDTMKVVDTSDAVVDTPDRSSLWHAHTPQVFPAPVLRAAYAGAGGEGTDDAALVERNVPGVTVLMVDDGGANLKVTRPVDVPLAEAVLASRSERAAGESDGPIRLDLRADPDVDLSEVVAHVRGGGLIAYPTETVYGLGGAVTEGAIEALRALKGRGADKPFIALLASREAAEGLAWTPAALELAGIFWPGPLTLVLSDPAGIFPVGVRDGQTGTVGVRVSPHPLVARLVEALDGPLTSTSLNAPDEAPATSGSEAMDVVRRLGGRDVLVLDAGTLPPSAPSTVVDCTGADPVVLRQGTVPTERLRCAIPEIHGE